MSKEGGSGVVRVAVLGATGSVGQRFIQLLCGSPTQKPHPHFKVTALGASERSAGKPFRESCKWIASTDCPAEVADLVVKPCRAAEFAGVCDVILSGMDASIAGEVETEFAENGFPVFSNARNHRFDEHVPILIPSVNPEHLRAVEKQSTFHKGGFIVTNPNCSNTGLCTALVPIQKLFGVTEMFVTTLQAVSGSGYPGLPFYDVYDNIIPFIGGEEEKMEGEPSKILGSMADGQIKATEIKIAAHCHRVAVTDGHQVSVSVKLDSSRTAGKSKEQVVKEILAAYASFEPPTLGEAKVQSLPSCGRPALRLRPEEDRPQPRLDRDEGRGFSTVVGRVRTCPLMDVRFTCLAHNTVAGGAGGSILNLELAYAAGYVKPKSS